MPIAYPLGGIALLHILPLSLQEGRLHHNDVSQVWKAYDKTLHPWMLRLTEEFDLTFPLSGKLNLSVQGMTVKAMKSFEIGLLRTCGLR